MPKLSSLKDFFGLIVSINAAWPVIVVVGGIGLSFATGLPLAALVAVSVAVILAFIVLVYQSRHRFLYISLKKASLAAFEQLDGTVWTEAASRMHDEPNPQRALEYMGQLLVSDLAVYGTRPPSTVFKRIDTKILRRSLVKENCETLRSNDPKDLPWTHLAVERRALKRRIKEMRVNDLPASREKGTVRLTLPKAIVEASFPELARAAHSGGDQALGILRKMVEGGGSMMVVKYLEGTSYQVGRETINKTSSTRDVAFLQGAVDRLLRQDLIRAASGDGKFTVYEVTEAGFRAIETSTN